MNNLKIVFLRQIGQHTRQEHEKTHSGERAALSDLHATYTIPTELAHEKLRAVKRGCNACRLQQTVPKSSPASYIISDFFGERILVDCKTLYKVGYLVVAVDHFATYVWSTFVKRKFAKPIAAFVARVFGDVDKIRAGRPALERIENIKKEVWWSSGIGDEVRVSHDRSYGRVEVLHRHH